MRKLEVIKDDLASYLKIFPLDKEPFTYYTSDRQNMAFWDLIGLRYLKKEPLLLDIRLMHIPQEARDYEAFVAERDAGGYIMFSPDEYLKIIALFEQQVLQKEVVDEDRPLTYFAEMNADEIVQLHCPPNLSQHVIGHYYRYFPSDEIQMPGTMSIISLPHWSTRHGTNQLTSLRFAVLTLQQLENPYFSLHFDTSGIIRFNRPALEELVMLLKRRVYPVFH